LRESGAEEWNGCKKRSCNELKGVFPSILTTDRFASLRSRTARARLHIGTPDRAMPLLGDIGLILA
jgi:hypothetical protein